MARRYYTRKKEIRKLRPGERIDFRRGKGYFIVPPPKVVPKPTPLPPLVTSVFTGKGLFTTSDAGSASGHPCDWVALQMDPEGDESPIFTNNPARLMYWQARPTADIVNSANLKGIPYIAQAESMPELEVAIGNRYRGGDSDALMLRVPKALVGNPTSWTAPAFAEAERQGWELILEWYWNAQPAYDKPNASGYRYFRNVCFGIYSEGEEGGEGYVPQKPFSHYYAVWKGSFSVWKAEAMTAPDWSLFDAV